MEIRHFPEELRFAAFKEDGFPVGELRYVIGDDKEKTLVATHTLVPPRFSGMGIAAKLTDAFIAYARAEKKQVFPICNYIVKRFENHPEAYKDVASKKKLRQIQIMKH